MASMLINAQATVTLCHSRTRSLPSIVRAADVVIAAVGKPRFVRGGWIKVGAVVIDAGYQRGQRGGRGFRGRRRAGLADHARPGGVGPMTIATLNRPHRRRGGEAARRRGVNDGPVASDLRVRRQRPAFGQPYST